MTTKRRKKSDLVRKGIPGTKRTLPRKACVTSKKNESEIEWRGLFAAMSDVILVMNSKGKFLKVAPTNSDLLDRPADEVIGKTIHQIFSASVADKFCKVIQKALKTKQTVHMEYSLPIQKKEMWFSAAISPMTKDSVVWVARDITEHKRDEADSLKRSRQLQTLSRASQEINVVLEIPVILRHLVASAMDLVDATSGTAGLLIDGRMVFKEYNENGKAFPIDYSFERGRGVPGWVMREMKPYLSNSAPDDAQVIPEIQKELGFYNLADVPILDRRGQLLGCFEIHNTKNHRPFDENDVELLQGLAASAAVALENSQMLQEHERVERRLEKINQGFLSLGTDPLENINHLTGLCGGLLGATSALYNRIDHGVLCTWGKWNVPQNFNPIDNPEGCLCYDVIQRGGDGVTVVRELEKTHYAESDPNVKAFNLKTYVGHPIRIGGATVGSLCVVYQNDYDPNEDDKRVMGVIASAIGVEEMRRQDRVELDETNKTLQSLIKASPLAINCLDREGKVTVWNSASERLFGWKEEEVLGKKNPAIPKERWKEFERLLQESLSGIAMTGFETRRIRKDGTQIEVSVSAAPIHDSKGNVKGAIALIADNTGRKQAEQALKASEARYRSLYNNTPVMLHSIDQEGKLISVSEYWLSFLEYDRQEVIGRRLTDFLTDSSRKYATEKILPKFFETGFCKDVPYQFIKKNGEVADVLLSATAEKDAAGKMIRSLAVMVDVTERLRTERERQVIYEIIQGVNNTANLDELLHLIHQSLRQIVYAENCFIALYDKQTGIFEFPFFVDQFDPTPTPMKARKTCSAYVVRTGQPMLITQEVFRRLIDEGEVEQVGTACPAWLGVPLKTPRGTIGVLVVQHYEDPNAYTHRDLEFLASVGNQVAMAVERKRSEDALRQSEQWLELAIVGADLGLWEWNIQTGEVVVNHRWVEMLGYKPGELENHIRAWETLVHPEDKQRVVQTMKDHLKGRIASYETEHRLRTKSGEWKWILDRGKVVEWDENGKALRASGTHLDINERRESINRIAKLNGLYSILSRINEAIVRVREPEKLFEQACRIVVSAGLFRMAWVGIVDPETLRVKPVARWGHDQGYLDTIVVSAADVPEGHGPVGTSIRENRHSVFNDFQNDPPGSPWREAAKEHGFLSAAAFPLRIGTQTIGALCLYSNEENYFDDEVIRLLDALADDISFALELADQEKLHKDAEERYWRLVELSPDAIVIHSEGKVVFVNTGAIKLFGADRAEQLIGHPVLDLVHPDYRNIVAERVRQLTEERKGVPLPLIEEKLLRLDGSTVDVEVTAIPFTFNEQIATQVVIRDITERKRTEEALRHSQAQLLQAQKMEAVGRLAGGVAHDFNNLLTAITGYAELLLMRLSNNDSLRRHAEEIKKAADRAAALTQQLLAFSRKQVLQPKILDLNTIVTDMDKMLQRLIGEDVELITLRSPNLGKIKADPGQIGQILLNLAVNARDAMPHGGKLIIETVNADMDEAYARHHEGMRAGSYIMLAVSDTGVGMDADTKSHLFEPFFTTKEQGKGTGLGLSTVYGIVKQSGGYIWVYSEVGRGTTFKVYLPRLKEPRESARAQSDQTTLIQGTETILLVEDEEGVRDLARDILKTNGYTVLEAHDGKSAIRCCEKHEGEIHLMVTDVVMPQMSGRELAEMLAPKRPEMKVLYMSGYTDDAILHHGALQANMSFLQKPFTPDILAHKVREVLDSKA